MTDHLLDGVFYINLDRRADRRGLIETELGSIGLSGERFVGIEKPGCPGIVGCGLSHLAVLKTARDRGLKNVLIFEDDFEFLVSKEDFWTHIESFFKSGIRYDVVMLSYLLEDATTHNNLLYKVNKATTASGYIVSSYFYDSLIELYETNLPLLESTAQHWIYANDQIWKELQAQSQWFAFRTRLGRQRGSYSDNSLEYMDRGV